jgi:hypothetical protein
MIIDTIIDGIMIDKIEMEKCVHLLYESAVQDDASGIISKN